MKNELFFRGLTSAIGLTCLVVACDTPEGPSSRAPLPQPTSTSPTTFLESPAAQALVTRASSFREKGIRIVHTGARFVTTPIERQVLPESTPLDTRVENGRLVHDGAALTTSFGANAGEPFSVHDTATGVGARVSMRGSRTSVAERTGSYVVYRGGHPLGDVIHRVSHAKTEDFLVLEKAPQAQSLSYDLTLEGGASLRLVANTLELLDANGSPRVRVASPYLVDSLGTRHVASLAVHGCAVDTSPVGPWGRAVVGPGSASCELEVSWGSAKVAYPALLDPAWQSAGSMSVKRTSAAIAQTNDGRVLVSGGYDAVVYASAEIFDPNYGTWATTGSMGAARFSHSLNTVASGSILAAGGVASGGVTSLATAELYDPATGTWAGTGSMSGPRDTHQAVTLSNGTVLIIGGSNGTTGLATAELFSASAFAPSGTMTSARLGAAATLRGDGTVLVTGGQNNTPTTLATSDVWTSGAFAAGPALSAPRYNHTSTLLGSGSVLLVGGRTTTALATTDLCGATCAASGSLTNARASHSATLLRNGTVLVAGGVNGTTVTSSVEVYTSGTFASDNALSVAREFQVATRLPEGRVFIAGGDDGTNSLATAEAWPQPTISATPGTNQVSVTWAVTQGNAKDVVSIAPAGSSPTTVTKSVFTNGVVASSTTFTGIGPGSYVARVYLNNSNWIAAESAPFTVAGTATSVTLDGTSVLTAPSIIVADYSGMSGSTTDFITVAPQGSPDTQYTRYAYTGGALSGQVTFNGIVNGTYVLRAYFNNQLVKKAESAAFTITGAATTVTLNPASGLTAPGTITFDYTNMSGSTTDWISLAIQGSADSQYIRYAYTGGAINGSVTFNNVAGNVSGQSYVGRAYFNNTYVKRAESAPFNVTGTTTVSINVGASNGTAPGTIVVNYSGMQGNLTDWISIAPYLSSDPTYTQYVYTNGAYSGTATFTNVPAGNYVARGYFNNTNVKQAESSPPFRVQ